MDENHCLLWLNLCTNIKASTRRALLRSQGSARAARAFLVAQGHQPPGGGDLDAIAALLGVRLVE